MHHTIVRPMEFGGQLLLPGGEILSEQDFRYFFRRVDYVLIGETHTNMTDHVSQAVILEKLSKIRLRPILGLEMLDIDSQPVLDKFNAGELLVDDLPRALDWARKVGVPFDLFRPTFETAARNGVDVYALNIPRRVVRDVRIKGFDEVAEEDRKYLPENYIPPSVEQQGKLQQFFAMHLEHVSSPMPGGRENMPAQTAQPAPAPAESSRNTTGDSAVRHLERQQDINGYIRALALWDSVMAEHAAKLRAETGRPVVIMVGAGHVEHGWGIAMRLRAHEPRTKVISIMPWRTPMEGAFMDQESSLLLSPAQADVFPPADLADAYYYSTLSPIGKGPQGMLTGQNPAVSRPQLMVLAVDDDSPAARAGIFPGDIILRVGERKVNSNADFYFLLSQYAAYSAPAGLTVLRDERELKIILP